ncbi:MAG: choice-of-anchor D domain-containing protein, partial [Candidatus Marinimicrobia bacterium]|nr:choice-of-anchor D domain-containing protein [Candidatus Neomarinimicrobiota bacterium]
MKLLSKQISIFFFIIVSLLARSGQSLTSKNAKFIRKTFISDTLQSIRINGHGTGARLPDSYELEQIIASSRQIIFDNLQLDSLPKKIDHSQTKWFPPIGDQGAEGSCVAWATGYYVKTFQEAREHDWDLSKAEWINSGNGYPTIEAQNKIISPDFVYHLTNNGQDQGITVFRAINFIQKYGASSWETMPNDPDNSTSWPDRKAWREAPQYRGASPPLFLIDTSAAQNRLFKQVLASGKLALIHINAHRFSQLSDKDLWTVDNYQTTVFNHLNAVVGYDDDFGPFIENGDTTYGAFKVANNWGKGGWENQADGFYHISYQCLQKYIKVAILFEDRDNYQPTILANFQLTHPYRGEIKMHLGIDRDDQNLISKPFLEYNNSEDANFFPDNVMTFDISNFNEIVNSNLDSVYLDLYDRGNYSETAVLDSFYIEFFENGKPIRKYDYSSEDSLLTTSNNEHSRASLIIHDDPMLSISQDSVNFAETYLNTQDSAGITVYNSSNKTYSIDLELNSSVFLISDTILTINPGQRQNIDAVFQPTKAGYFSSQLYLNYADGPKSVQLTGIGKSYPQFSVAPQDISLELNAGESDSSELSIENTGLDTFSYEIELGIDTSLISDDKDIPGVFPSNIKVLLYDNLRPDQQSQTKQYLEQLGVLVDLLNRPDAMQDSLLEAYDLIYVKKGDINFLRGQGEVVQEYIDKGGGLIIEQPDREYSIRIMPAGFEIGVLQTESEVNPNTIQFTKNGNNHSILNALYPRDCCGSYDVIKKSDLGSKFEVLAVNSLDTNNVALAAGEYGQGRILLHTGEIGAQKSHSSDLFVLRILEWTASQPHSVKLFRERGIIEPEASQSVKIVVNSKNLFDGRYNLFANLRPSGMNYPQEEIDLQINLKGQAQIDIDHDTLNFGSVFVRATDSLSLAIKNTGSALLRISEMSIPSTENFHLKRDSLQLLPGRSEMIEVYFNPLSPGQYEANLTIKSPDSEQLNQNIKLVGRGVIPPKLGAVPDSLIKYMGINDSGSYEINITNEGQADLEFDISVTGAEKTIIEKYLPEFATYISGIHYSKGSLYFIKRTDNKLFRYDIEGDFVEELFTIPYNSYSLAYDGENYYIGTYLGYIYGYDQNGEMVAEIETPFRNQIAFDYTGSAFIICAAYSTLSNFVVMDKSGEILQEIHYPGCYSDEVCVQISWLDEHPGGNLWGIFYNYRTENYWLNQLNYTSESIEFVRRYQLIPGSENLTHDGENFWISTLDGSLLKIQDRIKNLNWVQLSQNQGSILPQDRERINLRFNTSGMRPGRYNANIIMTTNDPDRDIVTIPAHLYLAGNYEIQVSGNWELKGLPIKPVNERVDQIFNLDSMRYNLYGWQQEYYAPDSIQAGQGFWIKSEQAQSVILNGLPDNDITISLQQGWNLISPPSNPIHIAQIMDNDDVVVFPLIFAYQDSYFRTDSLVPGNGYWAYASERGEIRLKNKAAYLSDQLKTFEFLPDLDKYPYLSIQDNDSNQSAIFYEVEFNYDDQNQYFKLPPLPPEKVFDARTLDGYYATASDDFYIQIQTSAYPLQLTNSNKIPNEQFRYQIV